MTSSPCSHPPAPPEGFRNVSSRNAGLKLLYSAYGRAAPTYGLFCCCLMNSRIHRHSQSACLLQLFGYQDDRWHVLGWKSQHLSEKIFSYKCLELEHKESALERRRQWMQFQQQSVKKASWSDDKKHRIRLPLDVLRSSALHICNRNMPHTYSSGDGKRADQMCWGTRVVFISVACRCTEVTLSGALPLIQRCSAGGIVSLLSTCRLLWAIPERIHLISHMCLHLGFVMDLHYLQWFYLLPLNHHY